MDVARVLDFFVANFMYVDGYRQGIGEIVDNAEDAAMHRDNLEVIGMAIAAAKDEDGRILAILRGSRAKDVGDSFKAARTFLSKLRSDYVAAYKKAALD